MKRFYILLCFLTFALAGAAQRQQKWKAPKRPKPVRWNPPKAVAPEVIDVWRPYLIPDNWFVEVAGGMSISMAENMGGHPFGKMYRWSFDAGIGRQFSYLWSTRFSAGYRTQRGWASKEALAASTLLGDGDYTYHMAAAYVDELFSLSRLFLPYNERRWFDLQLLLGVGLNYTWGFSDKTKSWTRYGYPVENTDFINLALRGGLQVLLKASETTDIFLQGTYHMVDDRYNGVRHSEGFAFDPYMEVSVGVKMYLMDHYGDHRYYKVRRWEATSLRTEEPQIASLLDGERQKEYQQREASEVVAFGELMKTRIAFYVDRSFINDYQMENLRIVADFLRKHPEVRLILKGYTGVSTHSEGKGQHLAERRVMAVRKALVRHYGVDASRLEVQFDETAPAPFPMNGEWLDAVVFQMVEAQ